MATLAEKLTQAKAIYNKNVSNKESSTIINRSKAAVDAAQKAYDASRAVTPGPNDPQNRARLEEEEKAKAYALSPAGMRAALDKINAEKAAADAAKKARIESDPDVIAARKLQAEAAAEVEATAKSKAEAIAATGKTAAEYAASKAAKDKAKAEEDARLKAAADAKATADAKTAAAAKAKAEADAKALAAKVANDKATAAKTVATDAAKTATDAILAAQVTKTAEAAALVLKLQEEARVAALEAAKLAGEAAAKDAQIAATATELANAQRAIDAANAATAAAEAAGAEAVAAAAANINQSGDVVIPTTSVADAASAMLAKELELKEKNDAALAKRISIVDTLKQRFESYGLGTLTEKIRELVVNDASEATITLALQQTDEYKERFKANKVRLEKGFRVLQPDEYLAAERSYKQTLNTYGLTQFDDSVNQFLENDTSATEINSRIVTAATRIQNTDPAIIKTLRDFYSLTDTDLVAYVLDTKNQLPEILKKVSAAEVGNAALKQGLTSSAVSAGLLVDQGVDRAQAEATYSKIADFLPTANKLSNIYGTTMEGYDQAKAEKEYFGQMASAKRARESLRAREIGTFSGDSGLTKGSLGSSTSGQY